MAGSELCPCALPLALCAWLHALLEYWFKISCLSVTGSCSAVIWSLCVQTSLSNRPPLQMREFKFAVASASVTGDTGRDFAFPGTNFVKALLAMLSALRLVAGSKHAPRAFGIATWQAGASSD